MLLSLTKSHLNNKGDEFTTASDIEINASACEMRSVQTLSRMRTSHTSRRRRRASYDGIRLLYRHRRSKDTLTAIINIASPADD